jgi:hypothetical protein
MTNLFVTGNGIPLRGIWQHPLLQKVVQEDIHKNLDEKSTFNILQKHFKSSKHQFLAPMALSG